MKHKTDQQHNWNRLEHEPDQSTPKTCSNITEHQKQNTEQTIHYLAIQRSKTFDLCVQQEKGDNTSFKVQVLAINGME